MSNSSTQSPLSASKERYGTVLTHTNRAVTPDLRFNVGDVTSTGCRQAAHRADAGQRCRTGATVRRRRLVGELQREQLLRGDGHKRGDRAHGQEAHLQGRCFSFSARWKW